MFGRGLACSGYSRSSEKERACSSEIEREREEWLVVLPFRNKKVVLSVVSIGMLL